MEPKTQQRSPLTPEAFQTAVRAFSGCTDNAEMHRLERLLQGYTKQREACFEILRLLEDRSQPAPIRQMLTLLLKRAILKNYMKLTEAERGTLRAALLLRLARMEPARSLQARLGEAIATVCKCENYRLASWPELCEFLRQALSLENREDFSRALVLLTCLAEIAPETFEVRDTCGLCEKIQTLFEGAFAPELDEVYILGLRALFSFLSVLVESDFEDAASLEAFLLRLLAALAALLKNQALFHARAHEVMELVVSAFEDLTECLENNLDKFSGHSLEALLRFVLDSDLLLSPGLDTAAKGSALDLIGLIFTERTDLFRPNKTKGGYLAKLCQTFGVLLVREEQALQARLAAQPDSLADALLEEDLSQLVLIALETACRELRSKQLYGFVEEMLTLFCQQGLARLVLRTYSATAEGLQTFYVKRLEAIYAERLLPGLQSQRLDVALGALKTLSFFIEYLSPDMLEHHQSFLPVLLGHLAASAQADADPNSDKSRTLALLLEHSLFALELSVENLEEEDLQPFSLQIYSSVFAVLGNQRLADGTKKTAISCLGAVFSTAGGPALQQNLDGLLRILRAACASEHLAGESLIALAKLSYYALKDTPQKEVAYATYFKEFFDRSLGLIGGGQAELDYEVFEGALTILHQAVKLFERGAAGFVTADLFSRVLGLLEDSAPGDDLREPLSEQDSHGGDDLAEPDSPAALARLPYFYMLCAGLFFLGEALRHLPDQLLVREETHEAFKSLLAYKVGSENEDVRHQALLAAKNYALGLAQYAGSDASGVLLSLLDVSLTNEDSDINVVRNLEVVKDFVEELVALPGGIATLNTATFCGSLVKVLRAFLLELCREEFSPENYFAATELITAYVRAASPESAMVVFSGLFDAVLLPLQRRDDFDVCVFEELYGFIAECLMYKPVLLDFILTERNKNGEFERFLASSDSFDDEAVIRNGMFLIGVVAQHMRPPFLADSTKVTQLLAHVQHCFGLCSLDVVKDNCVSACVKLYLNEPYAPFYTGLLDEERVLAAILSRIPLKGDPQETGSLLKGLLFLAFSKGLADRLLKQANVLLFLLEAVARRETLELEPSVLQYSKRFILENQARPELTQIINSLNEQTRTAVVAFLTIN